MYRRAITFCAACSGWQLLALGLFLAVLFEAITVGLRFGIGMQSTRDTAMIGSMTLGLRIHHGYIGLLLIPLAWCFPLGLRHALWMIAIGLIFSDLFHHFLVLWPITGSPQFDLVYPDHPYWRKDKS